MPSAHRDVFSLFGELLIAQALQSLALGDLLAAHIIDVLVQLLACLRLVRPLFSAS